MRHVANLFLGKELSDKAAQRVAYHVGCYGSKADVDFYHVCLCAPNEANGWNAWLLERAENSLTDYNDCEPEDFSDPEDVKVFLRKLHGSLVSIANSGEASSLLLIVFVLGSDKDAMCKAEQIVAQVAENSTLFETLIVVLSADFQPLISDEKEKEEVVAADPTPEVEQKEEGALESIVQRTKSFAESIKSFLSSDKKEPDSADQPLNAVEREKECLKNIVQCTKSLAEAKLFYFRNINSKGVSLNLDADTLCGLMGEFTLAAIEHYSEIFSINVQKHEISSFGISVVNFDRKYFVEYLQHKAFIQALDNEQITDERVDINKAYNLSQERLKNHLHIYSNIVEQELLPQLKDNKPEKDIVTSVYESIDKKMAAASDSCLSVLQLSEKEASLPLKEAALAMMLGEDDNLLDGKLYQDDALCIDDCSADALKTFVDENNQHFRVDTETGAIISTLKSEEQPVLSAPLNKEGKVYIPLDELRQMRYAIRQSTTYLRNQHRKMEALEAQNSIATDAPEKLSDRGLLNKIEEQPLETFYEPISKPRQSVDMRSGFMAIKDEGFFAASSAFALTSIIEYIIKKKQTNPINLSERFLFYNARQEKKIGPRQGVSFYDVLQAAMKSGICDEKLCQYSDSEIDVAPTDDAILDGLSHKVLRAQSVHVDHNDIVSALSDGYPVAVSLKVYNSFYYKRKNGFVFRPKDEEIHTTRYGTHTMVIVGFSNENKVYIVRNSWGESWGDNGYCYLPYSYIDDPKLNNGAYIVVEVDNVENVKGLNDGQKNTVSFSLIDTSIQYAIARILCDEEQHKLQSLTEKYTTLRTEYTRLFERLCNQSNCDDILNKAIARLDDEIETTNATKQKEIAYLDADLDLFDKKTTKYEIYGWAYIAILTIYLIIFIYYQIDNFETIYFENATIISAVFLAIGIVWLIRYFYQTKKCRKLKLAYKTARDTYYNQEIQRLEDEKRSKKLHFHVAGQVLSKFSELKTNLGNKYAFLKNYVENLKHWYSAEQQSLKDMRHELKEPFLSVLNDDALSAFFNDHLKNIDIHPYELLIPKKSEATESSNAQNSDLLTKKNIEDFHAKFLKDIETRLDKETEGFSISKALSGAENYPYLRQDNKNLKEIMTKLDSVSNPFVRLIADVSSTSQKSQYIIAPNDNECNAQWAATTQNYLGPNNLIYTSSKLRVAFIKMIYTSFDNIRQD